MSAPFSEFYTVESESILIKVVVKNPAKEDRALRYLRPHLTYALKCFEKEYYDHLFHMAWEKAYDWKVGHFVKHHRIRKGWSQITLAHVARMHPSQISGIERNRIRVGKNLAKKLADVLGCHYLEFL